MTQPLGQSDFDDLSAFIDRELDEPRRSEVESLIEADPRWAAEYEQMLRIDHALDSLTVPEPSSDLAGRMIREIRSGGLSDADWQLVSAYHDAELDQPEMQQVAARLEAEPALARAAGEMDRLDALLDRAEVPAASDDLAERIKRSVRTDRPDVIRPAGMWKQALALAAAAAVVVGVSIHAWQAGGPNTATDTDTPDVAAKDGRASSEKDSGMMDTVAENLDGLDEAEQLAVVATDLVSKYDVLEHFETLQAIEKLENQQDR
jgi:anti-sigma factor RsiW